ncbi:unnamed protein product [Darwinula stevensoni]|uniref:Uncharacterized protein n=1 Tax=Darwinula stevensoni TaxID=69355 RepID=A0A7R9AFG1_9CRUS|nr:unnamed protein product [Darwinula stevensoni]CAG0903300.1 unnamed protein product [Darwinula stevensoni]
MNWFEPWRTGPTPGFTSAGISAPRICYRIIKSRTRQWKSSGHTGKKTQGSGRNLPITRATEGKAACPSSMPPSTSARRKPRRIPRRTERRINRKRASTFLLPDGLSFEKVYIIASLITN